MKRKVENWKWKMEKLQNEEEDFFFLLVTFKTTKICFRSTKMEIFYREKHFTPGKKSGKMTLPLQKIFLLRSCNLIGSQFDAKNQDREGKQIRSWEQKVKKKKKKTPQILSYRIVVLKLVYHESNLSSVLNTDYSASSSIDSNPNQVVN